ncbi:MAG TPA: FGGY-family carbohydrate kinase, partial [Gammaproteobacteria bacterium]|nr:FGGY-family carbohydrate kinase [Gammaproteobacteria bacterium]
PAHGSGHLARALLEGCAFAMRDVLDRLRDLGVAFDSVVLLGGGARSAVWAKIRADLMGLTVERPAVTDTSPVGAAVLAAVAAGIQPNLEAAAECVAGNAQRIEPDADAFHVSNDAYGRYRNLFEALRPMFAGRVP